MTEELPPFKEESAFKYTKNPNPDWTFGTGLSTNTALGTQWKDDEIQGWKVFDPTKEEPRYDQERTYFETPDPL